MYTQYNGLWYEYERRQNHQVLFEITPYRKELQKYTWHSDVNVPMLYFVGRRRHAANDGPWNYLNPFHFAYVVLSIRNKLDPHAALLADINFKYRK